jgi:phage replication O-like protein O
LTANPQKENGYLPIANELAEAFAKHQISGNQWRLLWVIIRQTYGWNKKTDQISITKFQQMTGLDRRNIGRELNRLIARKIIVKNDNTFIKTYGIQKDYTKWKLSSKMTTGKAIVKKDNETIVKKDNKTIVKNDTHKRHKNNKYTSEFLEFWEAYPKKRSKGQAWRTWQKLGKEIPEIHILIGAIEAQKQSRKWQKNNGQYIPYPSTWLNNRDWEDEFEINNARPGSKIINSANINDIYSND